MGARYNPGLHRWSILLACCTLLLVVAGGLFTSRDAGLSVPDWPLSYGKLMPPMEGGILYEHGHRMVATTVGLLTIVSTIWLFRSDARKWLRGPAFAEDLPKYPIRDLSLAAPVCVLAQLALGAAARHKAIGSIYHICAAPIVTGVILWVSLRILLHYAENRELRVASISLLGALTMAASVALAILVRRNMPARAREFAATRATAVS